MPIIATAGHVDHGKSRLVLALTGRDPDRWDEEKRRGLTIDLGFAWTRLGDTEVGFVDVPGHERFIKNMLAGVGAVDIALFVVAADEGWMPQSEEHLTVLDTLAVTTGVVALTRCDLVDPELIELAVDEVAAQTRGTALQGWPIIPVSPVTGVGMTELRLALEEAVRRAAPAVDTGMPRMWIDRAFLVGGAGLVVTGTPTGGTLRRGDTVEVWPLRETVRIRSIQTHETETDAVPPGARAALNLPGLERRRIARGAVLGAVGSISSTKRLLAHLIPARSWPEAIGDRGAFHLHAGTGRWPVRIRLLEVGGVGEPEAAVLRLDDEVPLRMGDRFVLREVGRRAVVGGGIVLDPRPAPGTPSPESCARLLAAVDGNRDTMAATLLETRQVALIEDLAVDTGGGSPAGGVRAGSQVMTEDHARGVLAALVEAVADFHRLHPQRTGIPKATLASLAAVDPDVVDTLVVIPGSGLVDGGTVVSAAGFQPAWGAAEAASWDEAERRLRTDGLAVPRVSALGLDAETFHSVVRQGRLIGIGDDIAYLPDQIDEILGKLAALHDGFTVAEFRDALGVSRRHAVPLLEWLDATGRTSRSGDVRRIRRQPPPASGAAPTR